MRSYHLVMLLIAASMQPSRGAAQSGVNQVGADGDGAFLFAYRSHAGMERAFDAGYARHLDWHRERGDSLPWLAWTVVSGRNMGLFVDGTFGVSFAAFDERLDPRGDAADAALNVTAFATPVYREVYRLRRDLSAETRLETGRVGRMQRVVRLKLRPHGRTAFEQALVNGAWMPRSGLDWAIYECIAGGAEPVFVLIVQFDAWADLSAIDADPTRTLLEVAGANVERVETEIWQYRPDLSYFPERSRDGPP